MDMNKMMKQVAQMQEQMAKAQEELASQIRTAIRERLERG